jgi:DNA polymerase-3 subunit alpha
MSYFVENNIPLSKKGAVYNINGIKMLFMDCDKTFIDGNLNVTPTTRAYFFDSKLCEAVFFKVAEFPYYATYDAENKVFNEPKLLLFPNLMEGGCDDTPLLGLKTPYSVMESSLDASMAVKMAKKTGIESVGICDKNTLGGALTFQAICLKEKVKPILGVEFEVRLSDGDSYPFKFYGNYQQLLALNKICLVDNYQTLVIPSLSCVPSGIFIVANPLFTPFELVEKQEGIYYQFSTVTYNNNEVFLSYLINFKKYIYSNLPPIFIDDVYYTHKAFKESKILLNRINDNKSSKQSYNQFLRTAKRGLIDFDNFLSEEAKQEAVKGIINAKFLASCMPDEPISTEGFKIPKFLDDSEEELKLFKSEIRKGWDAKIKNKPNINLKEYVARVTREMEVIIKFNFVSYFLITQSEYKYAQEIGAYYGRGRGSGAGCMIAYLLGITGIDPIEHSLSFERFLNEGRASKSLPDLDCDFTNKDTKRIKSFLMDRFGENNVALIGTFGELTAKTLFSKITKLFGETDANSKIHSKMIREGGTMLDVMKGSSPRLVEFMNKNYQSLSMVECVQGAFSQKGIHACGVILSPRHEGKEIWDYIPVRKVDYEGFDKPILVTEFDGYSCDKMGMLKNDVLSLATLDMIKSTVELIYEKTGEVVDYTAFPTDCEETFRNFELGRTTSVFQFSSPVATGYVKKAKPKTITELSVITSLLRPATMNLKLHTQYLDVKNNKREAEFDLLLEDVQKETLGFLVFQEQVMKAFVILADFSDAEADDVRRAIGKKDMEAMKEFHVRFINKSCEKGYTKSNAEELWDKIVEFATYSFNKSHALSYAWASYDTMYMKTHYPTYFYATSLTREYSKSKELRDMGSIISEILDEGIVEIMKPDINKSSLNFDIYGNDILWGLAQVKMVKSCASTIIEERSKNGNFTSLDNFLERVKIKKNELENLVLAGAFDELEQIKDIYGRSIILDKYYYSRKIKKADEKEIPLSFVNFKKIEADLLGWSYINYNKLARDKGMEFYESNFVNSSDLQVIDTDLKVTVAGFIKSMVVKSVRNGEMVTIVLESNSKDVFLTGFSVFMNKNAKNLKEIKKGDLIYINGVTSFDNYKDCITVKLEKDSKIVKIC